MSNKTKYSIDSKGFYGEFGGAYVPEILYKCVTDLQQAYLPIIESDSFQQEYRALLRDYVGRPSPLYEARRMSEKYGCRLFLKREDLNHTGAHKINNTIGQILMARKMGKTRIIAETGAGQHGVATATVCALMGMRCEVFMGKTDVERQKTNVERMKMLGAEVHPVTTGNMTLSDACSEAIRDWCCHPQDTYYLVGSTMGPHPYPDIVARMQSIISEEIKQQLLEKGWWQRHRHRPHGSHHAPWHGRDNPRRTLIGDADRRRADRGSFHHIGRTRLSRYRTHARRSGAARKD